MPVKYFFHPGARDEQLAQLAWYDAQMPGLGKRYLTEVAHAISRACSQPKSFPVVATPDIRRLRVQNFPYSIIFRERNGSIEILAIASHKRRHGYWLERSGASGQMLQQKRGKYEVNLLSVPDSDTRERNMPD